MTISLGTVVYMSFKPLFKILLNCGLGFLLAKLNYLTVETSANISQCVINFFVPCLIFNKVVSSLDDGDLKSLGVIFLTEFIYQLIGGVGAIFIKYLTPTPKNWFGGLLVSGIFNNAGDLPIAFVTTLTQGTTLFVSGDTDRGIAYAVVFQLAFLVSMFNLGGYRLLLRDFSVIMPDPESQPSSSKPKSLKFSEKLKSIKNFDIKSLIPSYFKAKKNDHSEKDLSESKNADSKVLSPEIYSSPGQDKSSSTSHRISINRINSSTTDDGLNVSFGPDYAGGDNDETTGNTKNGSILLHSPDDHDNGQNSGPSGLALTWTRSSSMSTSRLPSTEVTGNSIMAFPSRRLNRRRTLDTNGKPRDLDRIEDNEDLAGAIAHLEKIQKYPSENIDDVINAYSQQLAVAPYDNSTDIRRVKTEPEPYDHRFSGQDFLHPDSYGDKLSPSQSNLSGHAVSRVSTHDNDESEIDALPKPTKFQQFIAKYHLRLPYIFLENFLRPPSAAVIVSVVVTMIPPVRRLFYEEPGTSDHFPNAPDGRPIFDFVMDFTSFVGAASVPLGLSILGATMARLKIKELPQGFWKSVVLMGLLKLVITPIISVAWAQATVRFGWIEPSNTIGIFLLIINSATPSATSQIYLTAMFSAPSGSHIQMDCIALSLIFQYAMLLVTLPILVAYTLIKVLGF